MHISFINQGLVYAFLYACPAADLCSALSPTMRLGTLWYIITADHACCCEHGLASYLCHP